MAETSLFCLFCEDVRQEPGGKQSWLGVFGDTIFVEPGTTEIKDIMAVCLARVEGTRAVDVTLSARVLLSENVQGPPDYTATYRQADGDSGSGWVLQLAFDLGGMPVEDGAIAKIDFTVGEITANATLLISYSPPHERPLTAIVENENGGEAAPLQ